MFLSLRNRKVFYDLLGPKGSPTVCMAHSLTADSGMWAEQVPALLAAGYSVLRVDMRGHGASDSVAGDCTMDDLADDFVHVVRAIEPTQSHFVGLSIGGMLGQSLGLRHADLFSSLMLCDTLPASVKAADHVWVERKAVVRQANSLEPMVDGTIRRWFSDDFIAGHALRVSQIRESVLATAIDSFIACASAVQNFDFTPSLHKISLPTLVVCGQNDTGTPASENKRLAEMVPGARYVEIPDSQHLPNIEQSARFNELMLDWLKSNTTR